MTPAEKIDFLQNYLGSCRRCSLCESRTQIVFGQGNPTARLMFIGDAPAGDDDRAGRPFAGASGELLNGMIKAMGLSREQVYIANVVKCRPAGDRRPQAGEVSECLPFLKKQIEVVQPEIIVALGGFATLALLGQAARRPEVRGSWQTFEGIALLPTFHPDDLLRDGSKKRPAWEDLQKVMKRLG
ncbi:uracil-DNA glycosylase [Bradymonadaceae bacterium TMQ3]|nr:uracil-DNA glycosylase [Bradymonadaceae bacterium TMQ3]TXC75557.1 uracil-DNA glycosylase [Bradymonadales bacterium TMQ1]